MPVSGGGFEQAYNVQAAVDVDTMLVVATGVTQAPNDTEVMAHRLKTKMALREMNKLDSRQKHAGMTVE